MNPWTNLKKTPTTKSVIIIPVELKAIAPMAQPEPGRRKTSGMSWHSVLAASGTVPLGHVRHWVSSSRLRICVGRVERWIVKFRKSRKCDNNKVPSQPRTWYCEQLKQCQQQLSPSTNFLAWPNSHGRLQTDSGGFGWWYVNCTSAAAATAVRGKWKSIQLRFA